MFYVFLVVDLTISFTYFDFINNVLFYIYELSYLNILSFLYLNIYLFCIYLIIINFSFRQKFIYFYLILLLTVMWGFYYSLEGLMFLILLGELLIVLLFILFYLTLQSYTVINLKNILKYFIFIQIIFTIWYFLVSKTNILFFNFQYNYDAIGKIISDDFFIFFYFLFYDLTYTVYLIAVLLTFLSIFFIFFYFSLKFFNIYIKKFKNRLYILRKQNFFKQSVYKTSYTSFQQ